MAAGTVYVYSKRDRSGDARSGPHSPRESEETPGSDSVSLDAGVPEPSPGLAASLGPFAGRGGVQGATGGSDRWVVSTLYRRVGKRQKIAGVGFVVASLAFLVLSVALNSVVLEIDSVVSFVIAAILFLKESRNRVQSRVLDAIFSSLGATISQLSSEAGSGFVYAPRGKRMSDVSVLGIDGGGPNRTSGGGFSLVPPGMGLALLFSRETEGAPVTMASLAHLLPSVMRENFGLAESVGVSSDDSKVEVTLRKPAVLCSCPRDEGRSTGVVGCTIASFLAVLYSYSTQRAVSLNRCQIDAESRDWKISMALSAKQE